MKGAAPGEPSKGQSSSEEEDHDEKDAFDMGPTWVRIGRRKSFVEVDPAAKKKKKNAVRERRLTKILVKKELRLSGVPDNADDSSSTGSPFSPLGTPETGRSLPSLGGRTPSERSPHGCSSSSPHSTPTTRTRQRRGSLFAQRLEAAPGRCGSPLRRDASEEVLSPERRQELDLDHVTDAEAFEFREIFDIIDLDGGGTIDLHELEELLDLLSMDHTQAELESLMEMAGTDEEGDIPFENFLRAVTCKPSRRYNKKMVLDAFRQFEVEGLPGYIHRSETAVVLSDLTGMKLPKCTSLLRSMGGADDFVHYRAYIDLCISTNRGGV